VPDINGSGFVPTSIAADLFAAATYESAVLRLARQVPMPAGRTQIPIPTAFPVAKFVNTTTSRRKPWTDVQWSQENLVAEELACVFSIPQEYLDDAAIDLWGTIRPMAASAMALAIDGAVLFGDGAPATFPAGGVVANLAGIAPQTPDLAEGVNQAMAMVEATGLIPTGDAAKVSTRASLRGLRDANGNPIYLPSLQQGGVDTLYGIPIAFTLGWTDDTVDLITGDWTKLVVGIRSDIRFEFSTQGVIADDTGKVVVSAFQDDTVLARMWMRIGAVIGQPVGPAGPTEPFAGVAPATP
jgi:HK97 family phage major capsid protein